MKDYFEINSATHPCFEASVMAGYELKSLD